MTESDRRKKQPPALDQVEAMAVDIPGALPRPTSAPMLVDVPIEMSAPAGDHADAGAATPTPMLVDVPIELPEVTPDVEPDGRPAADADQSEWVARAIGRGVPSYEAWAMTEDELKKLEH